MATLTTPERCGLMVGTALGIGLIVGMLIAHTMWLDEHGKHRPVLSDHEVATIIDELNLGCYSVTPEG